MNESYYDQLKETLYSETLDNGLHVYILPKEGFNKTYATFTTKYGSVDNHFTPLGSDKPVKVPDGIAHFLEHKLFEKEDGDVFQDFSKQGASANAFTSFTRTAYLFSSTSNVKENLKTLIDFVQAPYFTEKTVEKEKGIIGQEIEMYDDNPDWRVYFGVIENMFHRHPVKIDIAGTISSIAKISKDSLYTCYETFYHPSNMLLFVVGNVVPEEIISLVKENQSGKEFTPPEKIERFFEEEPPEVAKKKSVIKMTVQTPKCMVGFKQATPKRFGDERLKYELGMNLLLDYLFGQSSENYEELYTEGLIDQSFSFDYTEETEFGFSLIGGETSDPDRLTDRIFEMIEATKSKGIDTEAIDRLKKKKMGSFLRSMNSPEYIANQFTRFQFGDMNLFKVVEMYDKITTEDLQNILNDHFKEKAFTSCQIRPKNS
ncbi:EF-P 5-aminopentanol modification-associated protein YfmH [Pseudalkalibacillus salsuginis]|uniref:EF-P 5-aminopentanol modification-associated protein YfmH n=1 Tax=Pseudalkalibacillus salsuginis TaxID=2910972 RepID=UPI001F1C1A0C|nr:pitrilysin family protein [Pseudalkalibacillus salsuginis]MCF6410634.1 insulinase family protein [Pseudalkalibacillus salsuginis]